MPDAGVSNALALFCGAHGDFETSALARSGYGLADAASLVYLFGDLVHAAGLEAPRFCC